MVLSHDLAYALTMGYKVDLIQRLTSVVQRDPRLSLLTFAPVLPSCPLSADASTDNLTGGGLVRSFTGSGTACGIGSIS